MSTPVADPPQSVIVPLPSVSRARSTSWLSDVAWTAHNSSSASFGNGSMALRLPSRRSRRPWPRTSDGAA